jgi:hypothetical protein
MPPKHAVRNLIKPPQSYGVQWGEPPATFAMNQGVGLILKVDGWRAGRQPALREIGAAQPIIPFPGERLQREVPQNGKGGMVCYNR